jgi:hypothetical protein
VPRRLFTPRDLEPVRKLLDDNPMAAILAGTAVPFKRRMPGPRHVETPELKLPVEVQSRANPQGVPLHEIARALREEAPGVVGVAVGSGGISLKFDRPPTAAQRRKVEALLADRSRLERLKPEIAAAEPAAPRRTSDAQLQRVLRDPDTPDTAWLAAFRQYAVKHLIGPPPG